VFHIGIFALNGLSMVGDTSVSCTVMQRYVNEYLAVMFRLQREIGSSATCQIRKTLTTRRGKNEKKREGRGRQSVHGKNRTALPREMT
jgi:hypothetical protein